MITRSQVLSRAAIATVLSILLLTYLVLRVPPYQPDASLDRTSIALFMAGLFVFVAGVGTLIALTLHQRWPGLAGFAEDELLPLVAVRQGILFGLSGVVIALLALMQLLDIVFIAFVLLVAGLFEAFHKPEPNSRHFYKPEPNSRHFYKPEPDMIANPPMKQIRPWLPYAGSLLIVLALLWLIDLRDVLTLLRRTDLAWLAIGCGWYVLTNLLRAYRFRVLLDTDKIRNPFQILPEMFTLSLLNNVLPSRAGELSFPYFMQRRYAVSLGDGTATLLLARIFDLLAVILLYVVFAYTELQNLSETTVIIIEQVAIAGGVISTGILFAPWFADFGVRLFETVLNTLGFQDKSIVKAILRLANDAAAALQRMRRITIYGQTLAWSVAIWLATFAWFDAFLRAIDVPMRYALVVIGATFASVAKAIPLISIGGFGAHEAGWSLGFALVGMEQSLAISTGLAVNLLTLGVSIVFGGICLLYINK